MVARWKPVHLGHAAVLEALCDRAERVLVGIGSANRYDVRNPFTAAETRAMIDLVLAGSGRRNYDVVLVEDLGNGPRWRELVLRTFGPLDLFVTENAYVRSLLERDYRVEHPVAFVAPERRVAVDGTMVRAAMARGGNGWETLVPPAVARFIRERGIDRRFRSEFGLATLALAAPARDGAPG
jgi:nicotinamide-nucleotide adenylyltransferase